MWRVLVDPQERRVHSALAMAAGGDTRVAGSTLLIDQCYMWCCARGVEPIAPTGDLERSFLFLATLQFRRKFKDLNHYQRRRIAGLFR